jgi:N-acetylmuramoyl-L-alanine amidase
VTNQDQANLGLLALVVWREARGEDLPTKQAVAWSIRNRVQSPGWWGHSWWSVILQPYQYSSFNRTDPNATKWPMEGEQAWEDSLVAASQVYEELIPDPISGAESYFDKSLDTDPPKWSTDGSFVHVTNVGNLRFFRRSA